MLLNLALLDCLDYLDYPDFRDLFRYLHHHLKIILLVHQIYVGRRTEVLAFEFHQLVHYEGLTYLQENQYRQVDGQNQHQY